MRLGALRRPFRTAPCAVLVLLSAGAVAAAEDEKASSLAEALGKGTPKLSLRYRYENVSDDAAGDKEARASTLRTILGYETLPFRGASLYLEAENVATVGEDLYDNRGAGSLSNNVTNRPVVADPALTEINQAYLQLRRGTLRARLGRQEITLGDHRFVGNVGWRQNHQSFDGLTLTAEPGGRTTFSYAFIDRVNRIFGDGKPLAGHALNMTLDLRAAGRLTLYGYLLDYDRAADAALSTSTLGAELTGERAGGGGKLHYEVEIAAQRDAGDNPSRVDAGYLHLLAGGTWAGVTAQVGWERLEATAGGRPFGTPLATLHKFNGWADKFLATPPAGLEDLYLQVSGKAPGGAAWKAVWHDFRAAEGRARYGTELDLEVVWRAPWKQTFGAKAAFYEADGLAADTEKVWVWTSYAVP